MESVIFSLSQESQKELCWRPGIEVKRSMDATHKSALWQIHLLTVIVAIFQIGWLMPFFIETQHNYPGDAHLGMGGLGVVVVAITTIAFQFLLTNTKRMELHIAVALVLIVAGGFGSYKARKWADWTEMETNERETVEHCINLMEAEEIYHRTDYSGRGLCYSQRLYGNDSKSLYGAGVLWFGLARAEAPPGPARPSYGYLFKVLTTQGPHATGGQRSYFDDKNSMVYGYALVAYPAEYLQSGMDTFMCSGNGVLYQKDLGPNTSKIVTK